MIVKIKFVLNRCDISFIVEAPEDITLKQLLKQCDKIKSDFCACGIRSFDKKLDGEFDAEILIDYDGIKINENENPWCTIIYNEKENENV